MEIFINWLVSTAAVLIAAYLLPGVHVDTLTTALLTAAVLGIINAFLKPILLFLTLPLNILTLGLFSFVLNALLIMLASNIVPGFVVANFWWALLFSIILSLISSLLHSVFPTHARHASAH